MNKTFAMCFFAFHKCYGLPRPFLYFHPKREGKIYAFVVVVAAQMVITQSSYWKLQIKMRITFTLNEMVRLIAEWSL